MTHMTPEQAEEFWKQLDTEIEKENVFLNSRGWIQCLGTFVDHNGKEYVSEAWAHPITLKKYSTGAFVVATEDYLREKGWKSILEVERAGEKKWNKIHKMGRCQSPVTKRIYCYLEAEWYAIERNFDESDYPFGMSQHTIELNKLIKDFKKDEYFIWFHRSSEGQHVGVYGETYITEFWTQDEIKTYKIDEAAKISKVMIEALVSSDRARCALNWSQDDVEKAIERASIV